MIIMAWSKEITNAYMPGPAGILGNEKKGGNIGSEGNNALSRY